MANFNFTVDGKLVTCSEETTILKAALNAGIYIPHICSHPDLPVQGNCNLCVVEVEGLGIVKACETEAFIGAKVRTDSEKVVKIRNTALEFILAEHPTDCTGCKAYGKCELQTLMQYLGVIHSRLRYIHRETDSINVKNPIIVRENERCIRCGRCIRACVNLRGANVLGYRKKGWETYVGTPDDLPLNEANCRFCSACVEVCPTGALTDAEGVFRTDIPKNEALVPCSAECPAHIDIPGYIRAICEGDPDKAVGIIREKVPFPHTLGMVCNNRCEKGCKRNALNDPVSIRNLKRFAAENDQTQSWREKYITSRPRTDKNVAVIGGGAAGLTAAYYLNKKGHNVKVYEAEHIPGGHMTGGMPEYRIPARYVLEEIRTIEDTGVRIVCDHKVENVAELKRRYDAVLVAIGTSVGKKLNYLPGSSLKRVYSALEVLRAQRLKKDIELGDSVCIIGGGNVAFDVAGTLIRLGKKVSVVCLEKDASQADVSERDEALEEGVSIYDLHSNEAILSKAEVLGWNEDETDVAADDVTDGDVVTDTTSDDAVTDVAPEDAVTDVTSDESVAAADSTEKDSAALEVGGLRVHKINSFYFDSETHQLVEDAIPDSSYVIPCDSVVFAAGQVTGLTPDFGLELNRFGYPIDPATGKSEYTTSVEGVFAAGDVITGTKFVIDAIAGGRDAASLIDKYLGGDGNIDETLVDRKLNPYIGEKKNTASLPREELTLRPADERKKDFAPVSTGLTCDKARCEAGRCLACDLRNEISEVKLWTEYTKGENGNEL